MNQHTALAIRQATSLLPDAETWRTMLQMAEALVSSGLLPEAIKTPQAAVAIIQKGSELGVPPMYALSNIVVIKGKPTANAELMLALIYRDHGDGAVVFTSSDNTQCSVAYKRRTWAKAQTYEFTMADAEKASLLGNQTWQKYPAAMLRARCISAVARMAFPDTIGGLFTPEELGASVDVVDGDVVVIDKYLGGQTAVNADTGEIVSEPARSIVDVLTGELDMPDFAAVECTEIMQELRSVDERRDLSTLKARIRAAGLSDDPQVKGAYNAAYNRLTGAQDTSDAQPTLQVIG